MCRFSRGLEPREQQLQSVLDLGHGFVSPPSFASNVSDCNLVQNKIIDTRLHPIIISWSF